MIWYKKIWIQYKYINHQFTFEDEKGNGADNGGHKWWLKMTIVKDASPMSVDPLETDKGIG